MMKLPRRQVYPHPRELSNGDFISKGGLELYKLVYGLNGRIGRAEGSIVVLVGAQGVIIARLFGVL